MMKDFYYFHSNLKPLVVALVASWAVLTGCSTARDNASGVIKGGKSPVPAAAETRNDRQKGAAIDAAGSSGEREDPVDRRIQPADTVIVDVFGEKDLSGEHRVQAGGTITYPLLGIVTVGGKTTAEIAKELATRLRDGFLKNPQVSVNVKEYRLGTVSVMGFVEKPSAVKLPSEYKMDILEAIAEAGGFSRIANKGKIDLTRKGKTMTYSFDKLRKESDPRKRVWLQPGDVIYVHESII